jgi:hypothetical protein
MTDDIKHLRARFSSRDLHAQAAIDGGRAPMLSVAKGWLAALASCLKNEVVALSRLFQVARPVALVRCPKTQATYSRLSAPEGHPWRNR